MGAVSGEKVTPREKEYYRNSNFKKVSGKLI